MVVSLFYGTGLRMNELKQLKLADIDSKSYQVKVVAGKGGKDRFTILPKELPEPLRDYFRALSAKSIFFLKGKCRASPCTKELYNILFSSILPK